MTQLIPNPWISVSPGDVLSPLPSGEVEPSVTLACASGEFKSAAPFPALGKRADTAGADNPSAPAVFSADEMEYIPELFTVYAARRCMDKISPPLPKVERDVAPDFIALFETIKDRDDVGDFDDPPIYPLPACLDRHPRDLDMTPSVRSQILDPEKTRGIIHSLLKLAGISPATPFANDRKGRQANRTNYKHDNEYEFEHRSSPRLMTG